MPENMDKMSRNIEKLTESPLIHTYKALPTHITIECLVIHLLVPSHHLLIMTCMKTDSDNSISNFSFFPLINITIYYIMNINVKWLNACMFQGSK